MNAKEVKNITVGSFIEFSCQVAKEQYKTMNGYVMDIPQLVTFPAKEMVSIWGGKRYIFPVVGEDEIIRYIDHQQISKFNTGANNDSSN